MYLTLLQQDNLAKIKKARRNLTVARINDTYQSGNECALSTPALSGKCTQASDEHMQFNKQAQ